MVLTVLHHFSALLALPYREHMLKVQRPYVPVQFPCMSTLCGERLLPCKVGKIHWRGPSSTCWCRLGVNIGVGPCPV